VKKEEKETKEEIIKNKTKQNKTNRKVAS